MKMLRIIQKPYFILIIMILLIVLVHADTLEIRDTEYDLQVGDILFGHSTPQQGSLGAQQK